MADPVMAGAEPMSVVGGADGALLVHGFTGTPFSVRGMAEQLATAGLSVEVPLLPGHGTRVEDMVPTRWSDWSSAVEAAYDDLAARCDRVVVVGHSMGGTLALWLAERHLEISALVLVNPLVEPPGAEVVATARELLAAGETTVPGIGSDVAMPGVVTVAYDATPIEAGLSLFEAAGAVQDGLGLVTCPVLLFSSREDHVVAPTNGDRVVESVAGPVERVLLERSYHVAMLDHDRDEIEARLVAFVGLVLAGVAG